MTSLPPSHTRATAHIIACPCTLLLVSRFTGHGALPRRPGHGPCAVSRLFAAPAVHVPSEAARAVYALLRLPLRQGGLSLRRRAEHCRRRGRPHPAHRLFARRRRRQRRTLPRRSAQRAIRAGSAALEPTRPAPRRTAPPCPAPAQYQSSAHATHALRPN
eukprot:2864640-Pleurochrysis_carterae.AAC.2